MDKPKLRPIQAVPVQDGDRVVVQLFDPSRLTDQVAIVPQEMMFLLWKKYILSYLLLCLNVEEFP